MENAHVGDMPRHVPFYFIISVLPSFYQEIFMKIYIMPKIIINRDG